ncbi:uncharacterized protein IUM83_06712 [Phytophthora cinnamomi]|uniref:uncharacterized protein n=1 Tax=Phytophthora cinnamomi TaxID=4785 RepID=UPI003559AB0F|nr:hypothetical protein IUM83_06712 [Phytophthora cinnamomi]
MAQPPMRTNNELMASFDEGQVDYEESHTGSPYRSPNRRGDERSAQEPLSPVRTPNPIPDRCIAELLEITEPWYSPPRGLGVPTEGPIVTNDLDEAQAEHLVAQMNMSPRSQRPQLRPLLATGRAEYNFQPCDPVEAARQAAAQNLTLYVIGPPALRAADADVPRGAPQAIAGRAGGCVSGTDETRDASEWF